MPDRYYWDSCVFLSYVNGDADRLPDISALLEQAERGEVEILTSVVSHVEVAFSAAEKLALRLDDAVSDQIAALWGPSSPVKSVEFFPLIASAAVTLMRNGLPNRWSLQPMDAIHLATARRVGATHFHTYDPALTKYAPAIGMPIEQPTAPQLPLDIAKP